MKVQELWNKGIDSLPEHLKAAFGKPKFDLAADKNTGTLAVIFKNEVLDYQLVKVSKLTHTLLVFLKNLQTHTPANNLFILTPIVYPKIAEELISAGINFLDTAGNIYIDKQGFFLQRTDQKAESKPKEQNKSRLFSEAGLKLLFGILQVPEFINLSYREMAAAVEVSPASISIIFNEMLKSKYLHLGHKERKIVSRKKELLERWSVAYKEQLKPKLLIGNYTSKFPGILQDFNNIDLNVIGGKWAGEIAGNLYTHYLRPSKISLYVEEKNKKWMPLLKLIPEPGGEVEILRFFWKSDHPIFNLEVHSTVLVPPILVYADLITSEDSRNIETAQRIFDEHIQFTDQ
jgi:hypothetical protein